MYPVTLTYGWRLYACIDARTHLRPIKGRNIYILDPDFWKDSADPLPCKALSNTLLFWTGIKVTHILHLLVNYDPRLKASLMHSAPLFCNLENSIGPSISFSLYFSLYSCSHTARKYSLPHSVYFFPLSLITWSEQRIMIQQWVPD